MRLTWSQGEGDKAGGAKLQPITDHAAEAGEENVNLVTHQQKRVERYIEKIVTMANGGDAANPTPTLPGAETRHSRDLRTIM